mmetsp:Transcript_19017/g.54451  ORF Transcript_19017/g.54451 Transcript_19017/m.54451 type:complete len:968 (-) Transcript_19017:50-2953(-)
MGDEQRQDDTAQPTTTSKDGELAQPAGTEQSVDPSAAQQGGQQEEYQDTQAAESGYAENWFETEPGLSNTDFNSVEAEITESLQDQLGNEQTMGAYLEYQDPHEVVEVNIETSEEQVGEELGQLRAALAAEQQRAAEAIASLESLQTQYAQDSAAWQEALATRASEETEALRAELQAEQKRAREAQAKLENLQVRHSEDQAAWEARFAEGADEASASLLRELQAERDRAESNSAQLAALRSEYEQQAADWNDRFASMTASEGQMSDEMRAEIDSLKLQLEAAEEARSPPPPDDDRIAELEAMLAESRRDAAYLREQMAATSQGRTSGDTILQDRGPLSPTASALNLIKNSIGSTRELQLDLFHDISENEYADDEDNIHTDDELVVDEASDLNVDNLFEDLATSEHQVEKEGGELDRAATEVIPGTGETNEGGEQPDKTAGSSVETGVSGEEDPLEAATQTSLPQGPAKRTGSSAQRSSRKQSALVLKLRAELSEKEAELERLEVTLQDKLKELVDQGEKNYQLYQKLQKLKSADGGGARSDVGLRQLLVQDIAGEEATLSSFAHVTNAELLRVFKQSGSIGEMSSVGRAASVIQEGTSLRRALEKQQQQQEQSEQEVDSHGSQLGAEAEPGDGGLSDGNNDSQVGAPGNQGDGSSLLSRTEAIKLETELRLLKQANKRLQGRIEEMDAVERAGHAAIESMNVLKRRSEELAQRLRREKEMRSKTEAELGKANDRIKTLTEHTEKLLTHMKRMEKEEKIMGNELKTYRKEAALLRQRNTVLSKKNKSRERLLNELREGSRILEDQLRLMDQKYVQLRTKLDWTRATSNREVRKVQQEANKLRASFALAFSQATSGELSLQNTNLKSLLGAEDSDSGSESSSSDDENGEDDNIEAQRYDDLERTAQSDNGAPANNAQHPSSKLCPTTKTNLVGTAGLPQPHGAGAVAESSLPAIESIIPQGAERYKPRG